MVYQGMNFGAIVVSAIVAFMLGGLWYSPILFAKPWALAHGYDLNDKAKMDEMRKGAAAKYAAAFLVSLIAALILSRLFFRLGVVDVARGVKIGIAVWLGFVATVQLTATLFGGKKMKLFFIDTGYQLVCYIIMGAILAGWR
jgi:hypothetical protein